jgi:hypothetical protein
MSVYDYYGPNYLIDFALATRYSSAKIFGKATYFSANTVSIDSACDGESYSPMTIFPFRSSLISLEVFLNFIEKEGLPKLGFMGIEVEIGIGFSIDKFSYCQNFFLYFDDVSFLSPEINDFDIFQGSSISKLYFKADQIKPDHPFWLGKPGWKPEKLAQIFGDRFTRDITGSMDRFGWHIVSELPDGNTCDLFSEFSIPIEDLGGMPGTPFFLEAGAGLQLHLMARFEEASGTLIDEAIFEVNMQNQLIPPDSCSHIRLGYRVTSSGSSRITRLVLS